ncbi:spore maturation protein [Metallumcola ferriviriculae]|uniref:Spore maturation protein n=1 Tax=Metallumcola ferriviriculae TaxID=3039180 RepID=A0AAU0UUP8_9FIRM|nr:spore maturation protein [Desulfitibacteraceae bacterium MK1]
MVNIIWLALLVSGIAVAGINGRIEVVTKAAMDSAQAGVNIAIEIIGIMALWLGIMRVAQESGMINFLARIVCPITRFLFPQVPQDHPAMGAIIMNISANILGLGNAATPFGLKAMQELQELNDSPDEASAAMCTFLAINTSCITLIPATIIGIRVASGSANPTEIVGPTIFATATGTIVAVTADKILRSRYKRKYGKD